MELKKLVGVLWVFVVFVFTTSHTVNAEDLGVSKSKPIQLLTTSDSRCPIPIEGIDYDISDVKVSECYASGNAPFYVCPSPEDHKELGIIGDVSVEKTVINYETGLYMCSYHPSTLEQKPVRCVYQNVFCLVTSQKKDFKSLTNEKNEISSTLDDIKGPDSLTVFFAKLSTFDPEVIDHLKGKEKGKEFRFLFVANFFDAIDEYIFLFALIFMAIVSAIGIIFYSYHESVSWWFQKRGSGEILLTDMIVKGLMALIFLVVPNVFSTGSVDGKYRYSTIAWETIRTAAEMGNKAANELSDFANYAIASAVLNKVERIVNNLDNKLKVIREMAESIDKDCKSFQEEKDTAGLDNKVVTGYTKYCNLKVRYDMCSQFYDLRDGIVVLKPNIDKDAFEKSGVTESYCLEYMTKYINEKPNLEATYHLIKELGKVANNISSVDLKLGDAEKRLSAIADHIKSEGLEDVLNIIPIKILKLASENQDYYGWLNTVISIAPAYFLSNLIIPVFTDETVLAKKLVKVGDNVDLYDKKIETIDDGLLKDIISASALLVIPPFSQLYNLIRNIFDSVSSGVSGVLMSVIGGSAISLMAGMTGFGIFAPILAGIGSFTAKVMVEFGAIYVSYILGKQLLTIIPLIAIILGITMRYIAYLINNIKLVLIAPFMSVWAVTTKNRDKFVSFIYKIFYISFLTPIFIMLSIVLAMFAYSVILLIGYVLPSALLATTLVYISGGETNLNFFSSIIYVMFDSVIYVISILVASFMAWKVSYQGADTLLDMFGKPQGYAGEERFINRIADEASERVAPQIRTPFG